MKRLLSNHKVLVLWALFPVILVLLYQSHQNTVGIIDKANQQQRTLVEQNVLGALEFADASYEIVEQHQNELMEQYSFGMVEKYRADQDVHNWDLEELKEQFVTYDIYILNDELEIINTTFQPDLGLRFDQYPYFSSLLRSRLEGDSFVADRIDISTTTGRVRKYSYMPTPDNRYILELSVDIAEHYPALKDLDVFSHAESLVADYDVVKNVSFYKFSSDASSVGLITKTDGYISTDIADGVTQTVQSVVLGDSNQPSEFMSLDGSETFKYIPYLSLEPNGDINWWGSYVAEITYDNSIVQSALAKARLMFAGQALIFVIVFALFVLVIKRLLVQTERMAARDPLTELPNRKHLEAYFGKVSASADAKLALLFIDLDDFKKVNDSFGHDVGDQLLKKIAADLRGVIRKRDMLTRIGGDEFVVLLTDITSIDDVKTIAAKIGDQLSSAQVVNGITVQVRASIGVSIYPDHGQTASELMQKADAAMYEAKGNQLDDKPDFVVYRGLA